MRPPSRATNNIWLFAFLRVRVEKDRRKMGEQREKGTGEERQGFYYLTLEVTSHHFCCILFVWNKSLDPAYTPWRGFTGGCEYQASKIIRSHFKSCLIHPLSEVFFLPYLPGSLFIETEFSVVVDWRQALPSKSELAILPHWECKKIALNIKSSTPSFTHKRNAN